MKKLIYCCLLVALCQDCVEDAPKSSGDLTGESPNGGISVGLWFRTERASATGSIFYPGWTENVEVEFQSSIDSCDLFSDFDHLCNWHKSLPLKLASKITPLSDSLSLVLFTNFTIGLKAASHRKVIFNVTPFKRKDLGLRYYSHYYNDFAPRAGHALAFMKDPATNKSALWLIGGLVVDKNCNTPLCQQVNGVQTKGEIWKSEDGLHWNLAMESSDVSSFQHTLCTMPDPNNNFQMTLWKIGGIKVDPFHVTALNTVSKSTDGINWETCVAPFRPRGGHSTVVMPDINNGNKMTLWVIGGYDSNEENVMDVWKSVDGCSWTQVLPSLDLFATNKGAYGFQVTVFEDPNNGNLPTMWLTGGEDDYNNLYNRIWKSVDGINWQYVSVKTSVFTGRRDFQFFSTKDPENNNAKTMYLLGGLSQGYLQDLWKSTDGIHWFGIDISEDIGVYSGISGHKAIVISEPDKELDGILYVVGSTTDGLLSNTLFKSKNLREFYIGLTLPGWQFGNLAEFK